MLIDWSGVDPFWQGFIAAVAVCVLIEVVGSLGLWLWRRSRRRPAAPETPYAGFDDLQAPSDPPETLGAVSAALETPRVVPRFGQPIRMLYDEGGYVEPLRCSSGVRCGGRPLTNGEAFYMIPSPEDPGGPFLVLCLDDVIIEEVQV